MFGVKKDLKEELKEKKQITKITVLSIFKKLI